MKTANRMIGGVVVAVSLLSLVACGTNASSADPTASSETTQIVNVGTMGTYSPYSYQDDDGTFTGYDLEVLKAVQKIDSGLKFEFKAGSWDSLFPALDAGKDQVLANQIVSTSEREAKYYLSKVTYFQSTDQLIVKQGTTGITKPEDLEGKTIGLTVGDAHTSLIEDWNAKHGNILTIKYYKEDITTILRDIAAGRVDATNNDPAVAVSKAKLQGIKVEPVGEPLAKQPVHLIYKKNAAGEKLRDRIDKDLQKLKDNGTLSKLSITWFKQDYTK